MSTNIPPVTDEFVSDAVRTLEPPISAFDIAELWVDQQATVILTKEEFDAEVKKAASAVSYYLSN